MNQIKKKTSEKEVSGQETKPVTCDILRSPQSLADACICFIAININIVDSLNGFPDIVGIHIFYKVEELGKLRSPDKSSQRALDLFCQSYEDLVLRSLSITGDHLCFNKFYENMILFKYLNKLDISCNGIGDCHDILHHISQLYRLQTLCLRNNCMSDDAIRKMTSPIRILNNGPLHLQNLDISENHELSSRVVRYLKCFKDLQMVDLSDTSVREKDVRGYLKDMNLVLAPSSTDINDVFRFQSEGWAENTIETWKVDNLKVEESPKLYHYSNFYKKSKPLNRHKDAKTDDSNKKGLYRLVFIKSQNLKLMKTNVLEPSTKLELENENLETCCDHEMMKQLYGTCTIENKDSTISSLMDSW